jgi:hypothetical protein
MTHFIPIGLPTPASLQEANKPSHVSGGNKFIIHDWERDIIIQQSSTNHQLWIAWPTRCPRGIKHIHPPWKKAIDIFHSYHHSPRKIPPISCNFLGLSQNGVLPKYHGSPWCSSIFPTFKLQFGRIFHHSSMFRHTPISYWILLVTSRCIPLYSHDRSHHNTISIHIPWYPQTRWPPRPQLCIYTINPTVHQIYIISLAFLSDIPLISYEFPRINVIYT